MDDIRELKIGRVESPRQSSVGNVSLRDRVRAIPRAMLAQGWDPVAVGGAALEGLVDLLGFERGFIFVGVEARDGSVRDPDGATFQSVASRARKAGGEDWMPVRNPEFAVNRSVLKRAAAAGQTISINDCLVGAAGAPEEQHRAVLCLPFEPAPGSEAAFYIDRELGRGEIGEGDLALLEELSERIVPIFSKAWLASRVADLQSRVTSESGIEVPEEEAPSEEDAETVAEVPIYHGIVGKDEKLQKIFRIIEKIKDSDLNVCIFGESGTGKELFARAIHSASTRRGRLFVAENCGAIPENLLESELFGHVKGAFTGADADRKGVFEVASGGTLFLDEIGDMSEGMQRKLLRVLQENVIRPIGGKHTIEVDVRVICASNRDLRHLVQTGAFRADLYYRLNVITIEIPSLRDRPGDIPFLVEHFASDVCSEEGIVKRFGQSAIKALTQHSWPGNVRELRNVIRRVLITCPRRLVARKDVIGLLEASGASPRSETSLERDDKNLVLRVPAREAFHEIIDECEKVVLRNALNQYGWNKSKVTKALRIPRQSLYNKIDRYKLERAWNPGTGTSTGEG